MFIFERDRMSGGAAEREGDTESEAASRLPAVSTEPDVGLELMNCEIMTIQSQMLSQLSHLGAAKHQHFLKKTSHMGVPGWLSQTNEQLLILGL